MIVTFFSNFLNHHQLPFCKEMCNLLGDNFSFVATQPIQKERLDLGYEDINSNYSFVIKTYESIMEKKRAMTLGLESDIVITGSAPEIFIRERLLQNKLTFRYSERIFKQGFLKALNPRVMLSMYLRHTKYRNSNLHMLCASGYTSRDMALFKAYPDKMYKWGYFTEVKEYDVTKLLAHKSKDIIEILWVGRFIGWKHPEKAINVAVRLKKDGFNFNLKFIGTGDMEGNLKMLVDEYNIGEHVEFLGSMPPAKVREYMEKANIFLFTSDCQEGWGAVLNESMSSACAVVASHAIGSVPYLIKHQENGLIYKDSDTNDLYEKVKSLILDSELREEISENAYITMAKTWNPKVAAERIISLSENLLEGKEGYYEQGICSKAKILTERDFYFQLDDIQCC